MVSRLLNKPSTNRPKQSQNGSGAASIYRNRAVGTRLGVVQYCPRNRKATGSQGKHHYDDSEIKAGTTCAIGRKEEMRATGKLSEQTDSRYEVLYK